MKHNVISIRQLCALAREERRMMKTSTDKAVMGDSKAYRVLDHNGISDTEKMRFQIAGTKQGEASRVIEQNAAHERARREACEAGNIAIEQKASASQNRAEKVPKESHKAWCQSVREIEYAPELCDCMDGKPEKAQDIAGEVYHGAIKDWPSPLPWIQSIDHANSDMIVIRSQGIKTCIISVLGLNDETARENTKLIVRSVNHAEKLAEALRDADRRADDLRKQLVKESRFVAADLATQIRINIKAALAQWEAGQ